MDTVFWSKIVAIVGSAATVSWIGTAITMVVGALLHSGSHSANFVVPALFTLIGSAQFRHISLVAAANAIAPTHTSMMSLMRSEALMSLASLTVGIILFAMSTYRVLSEALPVFG
jgi:hypothetical protein